jgi:hypothetical protein
MDKFPQKSMLQFSLRGSFWWLTALAILLAIAVPVVRSWPPERQTILLHLSATFFATIFLSAGLIFWLRFRAEKLCGEILLVVSPIQVGTSPHWKPQVFLPLMLASNTGLHIVLSLHSSANNLLLPGTVGVNSHMYACLTAVLLMLALYHLWFKGRFAGTEFGENGMIRGGLRYSPWNSFSWYTWDDSKSVVNFRTKFSRTPVGVGPGHQQEIDAILQHHFSVPALQ